MTRSGSFGARPCRALRRRYLKDGVEALPPSWRRRWLIQRIVATPSWADFTRIRQIYASARALTLTTGVQHNVDHEIPLHHPRVCGLHVAENLRVLPARANGAKSNAWCAWHGELFDEPEQLRLWV